MKPWLTKSLVLAAIPIILGGGSAWIARSNANSDKIIVYETLIPRIEKNMEVIDKKLDAIAKDVGETRERVSTIEGRLSR
jgi:hypothetical protein